MTVITLESLLYISDKQLGDQNADTHIGFTLQAEVCITFFSTSMLEYNNGFPTQQM